MHDNFSDDDEVTASINVTPFVDVVLVLLVIFMLTTTFAAPAAVEVDLPRAAAGSEVVGETFNVVMERSSALSLNGEPITLEVLSQRLGSAHTRSEKPQVVIAADRGVDYGRVVSLIDLVKSHGIDHFALQIDPG
jgi:biopolymer transport protein ExbD